MTHDSPLSNIPFILPELKMADAIPLTGNAPPFPWEEFSKQLASVFDREKCIITCSEPIWRSSQDLYTGMGDALVPLNFIVPTLKGSVSWVIAKQEIPVLAALLLTKDLHPLPLYDSDLNESFYRFFAIEVLYQLTSTTILNNFSPIINEPSQLLCEDALCVDISLRINDQAVCGRLIISREFRKSWVDYFSHYKEPTPLSQELAKKATIALRIKAGETQLLLSEWMQLQLNDVLILDSCSLSGDDFEGRVTLNYEDKLVWRAKVKNGSLKILELPLLHEVTTPMAKLPKDDFEDDLSDFDFLDESTIGDSHESLTEGHEDVSVDVNETHMEDSQSSETNEGASENSALNKPQPTKEIISPEKIPVSVVLELGRVSMSVETLLKLEPGNLLEAEIHPKNGVDLTINGQVVGKGELVRLGESIGVRILQLGQK